MKDYYEVLGVSKNATSDEIKAAYRKQALKWHPDRNKSQDAAGRFKEINQAYEILVDPKKKEMYDQYGASAFERGRGREEGGAYTYQQGPFTYTYTTSGGGFEGSDFGGFSDPFEIFEQFFGFSSPFSQGRRRQQHELYEIVLTFDEAVKGVKKDTVIKGERRTIKIPAGVDDGTRIRFSHFDVLVRVTPHPYLKRDGQDIYIEKEISYPTAVLGGTVEVETIRGLVKLRVRAGTKSGVTVRLQGEGVVYPHSSKRGDQYVTFKIHIPEHVSHTAKKLLEELQKEYEY